MRSAGRSYLFLYRETEAQNTLQSSRRDRRLGCQRYVICKGFSTPQSLEWALLREANLNFCLNPAETKPARLSDAEPSAVILPEWPSAATLTGIQHCLVAFTLGNRYSLHQGKQFKLSELCMYVYYFFVCSRIIHVTPYTLTQLN